MNKQQGHRCATIVAATILSLLAGCHAEADFTSTQKKSYDQVSSDVFNFRSSDIVDDSVTISDGGRYTIFDVTQSEKSPYQVIQRQVKRQSFSNTYTQGRRARFSSEQFQLSEAGMIDFLLVIDDSRSMTDEQEMVATGLSSLISEFKDTNWQIAVISMSDPCVYSSNLIKKNDANIEAKFASAVKKPIDRRNTEQGFPMAIQSLKGQCNGTIKPWIRSGSSVGILFVSDEDNCGSDTGEQDRCKNIVGKNTTEMLSYLRSIRAESDAKIYSLVDHDGTCRDAGGVGAMYIDAARQTGGSVGSICNDYTASNGYAEFLKSVSKDVNRIIKRQFTLSASPDLTQFNINVDGTDLGTLGIVSIKGNVVTIDPAKFQNGMKITFSYTHDAVPMFSELPVSTDPHMDTLRVTIGGVNQTNGIDFTYNATRKVIEFTKMPPEDSAVSVSYFENKNLNSRFLIDLSGLRPDTLRVSVNGVAQDSNAFTYDDQGLDFRSPPTDGAVIVTSWKTEGLKILSYPASTSDVRRPVAWSVKDKSTGADVPAQWDGRTILFAAENVIAGRIVTMTIDFGEKTALRVVDLPSERIDDEIKILADNKVGVCEAVMPALDPTEDPPGGGTKQTERVKQDNSVGSLEEEPTAKKPPDWKKRYKGRQVSLKCKAGEDYQALTIAYKREVSRTTQFPVNLPKTTDPDDKNTAWKVYIDGKATKSFTRQGSIIMIEDDLLPPATRVDIQVVVYKPISG